MNPLRRFLNWILGLSPSRLESRAFGVFRRFERIQTDIQNATAQMQGELAKENARHAEEMAWIDTELELLTKSARLAEKVVAFAND